MTKLPALIRPLGLTRWLLLSAAFSLSACGGGGGDGGSSDASAPPPEATFRLEVSVAGASGLRFTWSSSPGASEYRLLESADGVADLQQVDSFPPDTRHHTRNVFLPARVNARYVLQACGADGCTDSNAVTLQAGLAKAAQRVVAPVPGANDSLGVRIALSSDGSTLAVGAHLDDSNPDSFPRSTLESGTVYVYTRVDDRWVLQGHLKADNADTNDHFGLSLALSADGNTLAVGAPDEDSDGVGVNSTRGGVWWINSAGAAYVFTRSNGTWTQQAFVKASNTGTRFDGFGRDVALSGDGNTLAVGANGEDSSATGVGGDQNNDGIQDSGAVYVFTRSDTTWTQQAYLKASNTGVSDEFGISLALDFDGSTLAVGAMAEDSGTGDPADNSAANSGAVYVFTRSDTHWAHQAYLKASALGTNDRFGLHLALSADGDTLAVGAHLEDGVAGDPQDNSAPDSGAVYVFMRDGSTWTQQAYLKASNASTGDQFGSALSLSADGKLLAVGAPLESSSATGLGGDQGNDASLRSGAVYVFARNGDRWAQQAYVKALPTSTEPGKGWAHAGAGFGVGVDFADDGSSLAIGAFTEVHSNQVTPGATYVY